MKISIIIGLMMFLISSITSVGQKANPSRSETESWLLEKMNKYVSKNSTDCKRLFPGDNSPDNRITECSTHTNISFSFSGDNLIITASVKKTEHNQNGNVETNFTRKITIPLYDLQYDFYITTSSLFFATKYSAIKIDDSNGKSITQGSFSLSFSENEEENFKTRFDKAMNHLRTFVKKPKSNEAF